MITNFVTPNPSFRKNEQEIYCLKAIEYANFFHIFALFLTISKSPSLTKYYLVSKTFFNEAALQSQLL